MKKGRSGGYAVPTNYENVNFTDTNVTYSDPKDIPGTPTKRINVEYSHEGSRKNLLLQIPRGIVVFGLSEFPRENPTKFNIDINIDTPEMKKFRGKLEILDNLFRDKIEQSKNVWGKGKDLVYNPMIRVDGEWPARLRLKLPVIKPESEPKDSTVRIPTFDVFDGSEAGKAPSKVTICDQGQINWDWVNRGMEITPVIKFEGIYIVNKEVYPVWRVDRIRIDKQPFFNNPFLDVDGSGEYAELTPENPWSTKDVCTQTQSNDEESEPESEEEDF